MVKRLVSGVLIGGVLLLVLDALAVRSGLASGVVPRPPGTALWVTSRAAGITAFLALTLDVVFGLFVSTGAADKLIQRAKSVDIHRWLSSVALGMTGLHAVALLGDGFVRFDVLDLLVPFASSYRPVAIALGVLAAYAAVIVHLSFEWRRRLGPKLWRKLHYLSFGLFIAALLHGLLAGSDTTSVGMQLLYSTSGGLVALLTAYRVLRRRIQLGGA